MKLTGCLPLCSFQNILWGRMYELHFFKSTCYSLDQCQLCERGSRVPYFLKRFRDLCVNGQKGLRLLLVVTGGGVWAPLFFCDGCILVCLFSFIHKEKKFSTDQAASFLFPRKVQAAPVRTAHLFGFRSARSQLLDFRQHQRWNIAGAWSQLEVQIFYIV